MKNAIRPLSTILLMIYFFLLLSPSPCAASSSALWDDLPPHAGFPVEWWYMTGFLKTEKGRHLGFQATFFRMENKKDAPGGETTQSPWDPREIFGFHGAVSNLDRKKFISTERERRGFYGSVATRNHPFSVKIGRNRLDHRDASAPSLSLSFRVENQSFALTLTPLLPPVWHAAHKKFFTGPGPQDFAYYYSYPLVKLEGTRTVVHRNGTVTVEAVHGQCWFDHEWMSSTLAPGQIGWIWLWDWNKANTRGIMLYQMLDQGGKLSPFHRATVMKRTKEGIRIERTRDVSLVRGMNGGCLDLKEIRFLVDQQMTVDIMPKLNAQRLRGAVSYWEGAADVTLGQLKNQTGESGEGYLEVTGLSKRERNVLKSAELCQSREKSR